MADRSDLAAKFAVVKHQWLDEVEDDLKRTSSIMAPRDTGYFASTLYARRYSSALATDIEIHAASEKPKAIWLRDGTRPHMIFSAADHWTNRSVVAFFWPKIGATIFRMYVNHPGTKPDHWADEVLAYVVPRQEAKLAALIDVA